MIKLYMWQQKIGIDIPGINTKELIELASGMKIEDIK